MLDTYEKADLATTDLWLWRTLLSNTEVRRYPIRLVVAGRYNLLNRPEWQTVQQTSELVKPYGPEKFTPAQTQDYLAKIGIDDPATVERIHQVTKGWPYYLNKIRETQPSLNPEVLTQDLATFLVNHLPPAEQTAGKQLAQLAACCRWFDGPMIESLAQQFQLVPPLPQAGLAPGQAGCLTWLKEQTFVEPLSSGRWRLDDVARDVFRLALGQEDQPRFKRTHDLLARYFKTKSSQAVAAQTPTTEKYENPDWREPRGEYLYHLSFTQSAHVETTWLSHLLEATYLGQQSLVRTPLQALTEDYALADHPHLNYTTRRFLQRVRPAVEYGWAVLEKDPIDYPYNEANLGLSKEEIDQAVAICLDNPDQFEGLARFAALLYKAKHCAKGQALGWLEQAQAQAKQLITETPEFLAELFLYKLGSTFDDISHFEKAIACYDVALDIKPDYHVAFNNKGVALAALGNYEAAISCYDAALAIKSDLHEGLINRGAALIALVQYEAAIATFDAGLAIKPDKYDAFMGKGYALSKLGQYEAAIVCFDTALFIQPNYHYALMEKGYALSKLGQYETAIVCFDDALAIKADDDDVIYNKACYHGLKGDADIAIPCLQAAIALDPENRDLAKTDTDFDPIRHDERFRALVEGG